MLPVPIRLPNLLRLISIYFVTTDRKEIVMPVYDLAKILEEIHWEDYAEFDNPPEFAVPEEKEQKLQKLLAKCNNGSEEAKNNNARLVKTPK